MNGTKRREKKWVQNGKLNNFMVSQNGVAHTALSLTHARNTYNNNNDINEFAN